MAIPHPIPYQGSKRALANIILSFFPSNVEKLIEPFSGSAAVSIAAAYHRKAKSFHLNDLNNALIDLWNEIINKPQVIAKAYEKLWFAQEGREREFYDLVRKKFNHSQRPDYFLYLLARCVKASVRYNSNGEFNQSPDNRRKGANPDTMKANILGASHLLKGRSTVTSSDYEDIMAAAESSDMVYMDPPYQGVCSTRDSRYINGLQCERFVEALHRLNNRKISYIVSYDGRTGSKAYGKLLPDFLRLKHLEIDAGRSSQSTLLGRADNTIESLYLSPALVLRIDNLSINKRESFHHQNSLFEAAI
ncbi:MAG: DNA adenine methylase [Nitrospiraceae bacterium]|nr:MAG: DNA adenine methylase [Nitrospiraceae bacterium]